MLRPVPHLPLYGPHRLTRRRHLIRRAAPDQNNHQGTNEGLGRMEIHRTLRSRYPTVTYTRGHFSRLARSPLMRLSKKKPTSSELCGETVSKAQKEIVSLVNV